MKCTPTGGGTALGCSPDPTTPVLRDLGQVVSLSELWVPMESEVITPVSATVGLNETVSVKGAAQL